MFRNEKPQTGRWVCMIKVRLRVGDLRQLRSSLWVRSTSHIPSPTPSPPANRCNSYLPSYPSTRAIPIPTRQPLIIPEPTRDPEKSSTSSASMNVIRLLPPDTTPVHSSLSSRLISPSFLVHGVNPRVTVTSTYAGSFIASCDTSQSHTSTTSSDQIKIHISGAFKDIEPPCIGEGLMTSSPVPSSWPRESPSNACARTPHPTHGVRQ